MKPINVNAFDVIGDMAAEGVIAFGAAVYRSGAAKIKGSVCTGTLYNLLGIADWDLVEKTEEGFYALYDSVPVITAGRCRVWVTPNDSDISIIAGDYLDLANLGLTNALPVGVFEESGATAGQTRVSTSMARALEDATLTTALKYVLVDSTAVSIGDTTVTLTTAKAALFTEGDYILLEDLDGNCMINRVKSISGVVLTLELASTVALAANTDYLHILTQVEVILI